MVIIFQLNAECSLTVFGTVEFVSNEIAENISGKLAHSLKWLTPLPNDACVLFQDRPALCACVPACCTSKPLPAVFSPFSNSLHNYSCWWEVIKDRYMLDLSSNISHTIGYALSPLPCSPPSWAVCLIHRLHFCISCKQRIFRTRCVHFISRSYPG